jgi:hypothetical protein
MKKTFSTRERLLKSRAAKRRHNLKTAPKTFGRVATLEEKNKSVLDSLEAKLKNA